MRKQKWSLPTKSVLQSNRSTMIMPLQHNDVTKWCCSWQQQPDHLDGNDLLPLELSCCCHFFAVWEAEWQDKLEQKQQQMMMTMRYDNDERSVTVMTKMIATSNTEDMFLWYGQIEPKQSARTRSTRANRKHCTMTSHNNEDNDSSNCGDEDEDDDDEAMLTIWLLLAAATKCNNLQLLVVY
jgi:hypothetical protein